MNLIIDFYKELDTINLIIFWGTILVIFLLLIFSIIIANKNKKLKRIIYNKEQELEESKNETIVKQNITNKEEITINNIEDTNTFLPIKEDTQEELTINNNVYEEKEDTHEEIVIKETNNNYIYEEEKNIINEKEEEISTKDEFIAEEYVKPTKEIIIPNAPYQRNVLREMSLGQTSPIGITKKEPNPQKEILNRNAQQTTIQNVEIIEDSITNETYKNNYQEEMNNSKKMINKIYEEENKAKEDIQNAEIKRNNYLQELSKKLEETSKNDIERTAYEIKQEEDAIISYDELMKKKDTLKIEDEEDAIISIEELRNKKREQERIYNITKDEENDEFISELKDFRSDL